MRRFVDNKPQYIVGGNTGPCQINHTAAKSKDGELVANYANSLLENKTTRNSFFKKLIDCLVAKHNRSDINQFLNDMVEISEQSINYNYIKVLFDSGVNNFGYTTPEELENILNNFGTTFSAELYSHLTINNINLLLKYLNFNSYIEQLSKQPINNITYLTINQFIEGHDGLNNYMEPYSLDIRDTKEINALSLPKSTPNLITQSQPTVQIKKENFSPINKTNILNKRRYANSENFELKLIKRLNKYSDTTQIGDFQNAFKAYYNNLKSEIERFEFAKNVTKLYNDAL
ncbi:MAG: hypothetical protein KBD37_03805 [Burkholderiales bacterium]|nr:hypothetical protein [Burkholderiales bacterium]